MLPRNHPDHIQIAFDDHRLVANAGLLLPATLAHHLGLSQLVQERLGLGDAPGRANTGDKVMTLVASALAGGDCIDDADALRTGGTACTLGGTVKPESTDAERPWGLEQGVRAVGRDGPRSIPINGAGGGLWLSLGAPMAVLGSGAGRGRRDSMQGKTIADRAGATLWGGWVVWWTGQAPSAPSGRQWQGSQSSQGASELGFPRPALGKMQSEAARRAGEPSGHREEAPP